MNNYQRLEEQRNRYWARMDYSGKNLTSVLVAFEVASALPITVCKSILEFNQLWSTQMEEAKGTLREIHANAMGFEPFEVLDQVRIIQQVRCFDSRSTIRAIGCHLNVVAGDIVAELIKDHGPDEWLNFSRAIVEELYVVKHASFRSFVSVDGSREATILRDQIANEVDGLVGRVGGGVAAKTSRQMGFEQQFGERTGDVMIEILSVVNNLDFKRPSKAVRNYVASEMLKVLGIPVTYNEVFFEALENLVEI